MSEFQFFAILSRQLTAAQIASNPVNAPNSGGFGLFGGATTND
jgi:hypothetical protein